MEEYIACSYGGTSVEWLSGPIVEASKGLPGDKGFLSLLEPFRTGLRHINAS